MRRYQAWSRNVLNWTECGNPAREEIHKPNHKIKSAYTFYTFVVGFWYVQGILFLLHAVYCILFNTKINFLFPGNHNFSYFWFLGTLSLGKDAKRSILLKSEIETEIQTEIQSEIEYAFYRETVAKKYAKFFQSTLHHNNGYFLQV